MADHLPECEATDCGCAPEEECGNNCIHDCICDRLRAAEQRGYENGCIHGAAKYPDIYRDGVKAARDAVAALPAYYAIEECQGNPLEKGDPEDPDPWKQGHLIERDDALDAIDGVGKP